MILESPKIKSVTVSIVNLKMDKIKKLIKSVTVSIVNRNLKIRAHLLFILYDKLYSPWRIIWRTPAAPACVGDSNLGHLSGSQSGSFQDYVHDGLKSFEYTWGTVPNPSRVVGFEPELEIMI